MIIETNYTRSLVCNSNQTRQSAVRSPQRNKLKLLNVRRTAKLARGDRTRIACIDNHAVTHL